MVGDLIFLQSWTSTRSSVPSSRFSCSLTGRILLPKISPWNVYISPQHYYIHIIIYIYSTWDFTHPKLALGQVLWNFWHIFAALNVQNESGQVMQKTLPHGRVLELYVQNEGKYSILFRAVLWWLNLNFRAARKLWAARRGGKKKKGKKLGFLLSRIIVSSIMDTGYRFSLGHQLWPPLHGHSMNISTCFGLFFLVVCVFEFYLVWRDCTRKHPNVLIINDIYLVEG